MQIKENLEDLDKETLYSRVDQLATNDTEHTVREHMKAVILRQIYNSAQALYEGNEPIEYVLAEKFDAGKLAREFSNLAEEYTKIYFPEYEERKWEEKVSKHAKDLEELLLARGRANL